MNQVKHIEIQSNQTKRTIKTQNSKDTQIRRYKWQENMNLYLLLCTWCCTRPSSCHTHVVAHDPQADISKVELPRYVRFVAIDCMTAW